MSTLNVTFRAAKEWERRAIQGIEDNPLGSDACVVCEYGEMLLGWADDYWTFRPLTIVGRRARKATQVALLALKEMTEVIE